MSSKKHSNRNKYIKLLNNPPQSAKGLTRWWWYGTAVTEDEITRELEMINAAGIGGVELQILYPLQEDKPEQDMIHYHYYSPGFFEMIDYTLDECERLGLEFDYTPGSSWPYGGPFITRDMAPEVLVPYQQVVSGPDSFDFDYTGVIVGDIVGAVMGQMKEGKIIRKTLTDITDKLESTWIYSWPYGYKFDNLEIPEGQWLITVFVSSKYRQQVGAPAHGAAGNVMDHCRRDVTRCFFENMGETLIEKTGKGRIRSFFCDSIELGGNNWTSILIDEFKKRRGYDIKEYLPALWNQVTEVTPYLRYDFYKTMSELTIENFFEEMTDWCHQQETKSKIQAHGTWGDILQAYAAADIPEGETFGEGDVYEVNTIHRRLASSAGNIYGHKIISNESFTWLRMPRFLVNLEMIKLAADAIFLDGINQIINHGYAYSPEEVGQPGWAFYASSMISHTNTWWQYYPEVAQYIQKVSAFLQRGHNYAEIAIYLPQNDIWAETPISELHMSMKLEKHMDKKAINSIQKHGYWFNYINDEAVQDLGQITEKGLKINHNDYKVIILPAIKRMPPGTACKLKQFAENGGILIAAELIPDDVCGYIDCKNKRQQLQQTMADLFPGRVDCWQEAGNGKTIISSDRYQQLISHLHSVWKPDLEIKRHQDVIGYVHRQDEDDDIYLTANISREQKSTVMEFKINNKGFIILDPLSGDRVKPLTVDYKRNSTEVEIDFAAGGSYLFIFSEKYEQSKEMVERIQEKRAKDISGNWLLTIEELDFRRKLSQLQTWEQFEEAKYYCGQGIYSKKIKITPELLTCDKIDIVFAEIGEVAEVLVNGVNTGVIWKHPYRLNIKDYLDEGTNLIEVRVTNLWINNYLNPEREEKMHKEKLISEWPYFTDVIDNIREKRLYSWREQEMLDELQPSGLKGSVSLKAYI